MRAVRLLIWASGGALCAGMILALGPVDQPEIVKHRILISYILLFVGLTIGVIVWDRRPDNRIGILLTAWPLVSILPDARWIFWNHALPVTLGFATIELFVPVFVHLTLAYPTGRLTTRLDRFFVGLAYAFAAAYGLLYLLLFDPLAPSEPNSGTCFVVGCARPITHITTYNVHRISHVFGWFALPLAVVYLALLVRKFVRLSPGGRRIVLPFSIAAFLVAGQFVVQIALYGSPGVNTATNTKWFWITNVASLLVPIVLGVGLLRGRSGRSAVADLVVELERTPPGSVREALARALGDPSLELALWLPERGSYVDSHGRPVELPAPGHNRAVTILGPSEAPIAALLHDPVLLERRGLLEAAGAAARLALENERLQAELRAQVAELHASRTRIVQAGDEERRRLERNLHDGAQQRLLSLGLALQLARAELGPQANGATELLAEAEDELRAALDELRELARGIHPAILTDQGLAAAVRSLAERSAVPVNLVTVPDERLGEPIEAAAYFIVSESLANCAKYAHASSVRVSVARCDGKAVIDIADNGAGGADPACGSGLRGLSDRVQTLDGTFSLDSPAGRGTHIHAEIPCAS
jgi:signal transduction histidine kinase